MKIPTKKTILLIIGACLYVVLALSFLFFLFYTQKDRIGPNDPNYGWYTTLFYNNKCVAAHPEKYNPFMKTTIPATTFDDETAQRILDGIDGLGIPKKKALEIFYKARNEWYEANEDGSWGTWENCKKETLTYYDFAISLLEKELMQRQ